MKQLALTLAAALMTFGATAQTIEEQIAQQFRFGTGEYKMRFERNINHICGAITVGSDTTTLALGHESIDEYTPVQFMVFDNGDIDAPVNIEITGFNTYGDHLLPGLEFDEVVWLKLAAEDGQGDFLLPRGDLRGVTHDVTQGAVLSFNAKVNTDEANIEQGLWFVGPRLQVNCWGN